ncbi:hypothetical protein ACHAW6_001976 [Cyclotella cf. meneghiniana]
MCLLTMNSSHSFAIGHTKCSTSQSCARQQSKKRFPKRISFNENVAVRSIRERSSEMSPEDKSKLYYVKDELRRFESELIEVRRKIIVQARSLYKSNPAMSLAQHVSSILESDESLRGFEIRFCPTRCKNKSKVLNAVLQYQEKLRFSEKSSLTAERDVALAKAYSELSQLSKVQALKTARNDKIRARLQNDENDIFCLPSSPLPGSQPVSVLNAMIPILEIRKRRDFAEETSQLKKCRVF